MDGGPDIDSLSDCSSINGRPNGVILIQDESGLTSALPQPAQLAPCGQDATDPGTPLVVQFGSIQTMDIQPRRMTVATQHATFQIELDKEVGSGSFGKVYHATHVATGETVAVKIARKGQTTSKTDAHVQLLNEFNLLGQCNHETIVKCLGYAEDAEHAYLFLELVVGKTLLEIVNDLVTFPGGSVLSENVILEVAKQLLQAVMHLRSKSIVHRDIKLENILVDVDAWNNDGVPKIKLIDFGVATHFYPGKSKNLTAYTGSVHYMAPEVFYGNYDHRCDIWSIGVVLFILATNRFPFEARSDEALKETVQLVQAKFKKKERKLRARTTRKFILKFLVKSFTKRADAKAIYFELLLLTTSIQLPSTRGFNRIPMPTHSLHAPYSSIDGPIDEVAK